MSVGGADTSKAVRDAFIAARPPRGLPATSTRGPILCVEHSI